MRICVVSGSPRGSNSVTLHTVLYLQKLFPRHEFTVIHAGKTIKALERDFSPAIAALEGADMLLFCYPVYTFLAPSQLHRFIELLKASGISLEGKTAAQLTTSKRFFDFTAHGYIEANCADLGLKYLGGLSADMDDLLTEKGRREAEAFFRLILRRAERGVHIPFAKTQSEPLPEYIRSLEPCAKKAGFDTVIVADIGPEDSELSDMVEDFRAAYPYPVRVVNIREFPFRGGCMGCFNCASDGKCVYTDGFDRLLREEIQKADATVYAFTLQDHCMGSRFKMFDDRQFCNGHRTVTSGKPVGYICRGWLDGESNLREVLTGRGEVGGNFVAGMACDAVAIVDMAQTLAYALDTSLTQPPRFFGVGGMKIFRDMIWLMQGLMRADHKFYKAHGQYDFPQKKPGTLLKMKLVGGLIASPAIRKKIGGKMDEAISGPYKKVVDAAQPRGDTI